MKNKFNIEEVNAWLKEQYGMSYDDLSKEFNKAVDLLSESLKQRKEMRNKLNKVEKILNANTHIENIYHALSNLFDKEYQYEIDNEELNEILKEDKLNG